MLRRVAVQPGVHHPDIYLADLWGYRLTQVHQDSASPPNITFDRVFGNVLPQNGLFNEPSGLTFGAGHLFVADSVNQRMQAFDPSTYAFQFTWGERGWGANDEGFNWPRDITYVAATNTLWVADTKNGRLVEFNTDGTATRAHGRLDRRRREPVQPALRDPDLRQHGQRDRGRLVQQPDRALGRLVVGHLPGADVVELLHQQQSAGRHDRPDRHLQRPADRARDRHTQQPADSPRRHDRAQIGGYLTGGSGSQSLHSPEGLAVDSAGNIWVGDRAFNRLVELSSSGSFLQAFGKLGTGHGQFNHPTHLDIEGNLLYVCDVYNDRIQVFNLAPVVGSQTDTFTGHVDASGTVSWKHAITVGDTNAPITATLTWTTGSANLNEFLMPPGSSTAVAQSTTNSAQPKTITFQPTVTGSWTVRVKAVSGASDFTLQVTHD